MNAKKTLHSTLLLAWGLIVLTAFISFPVAPLNQTEPLTWQMGSTPSPTLTSTATVTATSTVTATLTVTPTATLTVTIAATPTVQPTRPRGDMPENAQSPTFVRPYDCIDMMCPGASGATELNAAGGWQFIEAKTTVWFRMSDWGSLQLNVWLYANDQGGMSFDMYAPDQRDLYGPPIGRGSLNPSQRPADLFWTGRTKASGMWYAKVTNHNPFPVMYSLRYTVSIPPIANRCDACHGPLRDLMWDRCVSSGNNWCNDLSGLYDTNPSTFDHSIPKP